jgi:hypothetical protein
LAIVVTIGATIGKLAAYQLKRLEPVLQRIAPSTTLPIMNQQQVGDLPAAIPPIEGQWGIIAYIDTEAHKVDVLVNKMCDSISKLCKHRTVLISATVTGKIDVSKEVV